MTQAPAVPTLAALRERRDEILRVAAAHDASNVRIFGSVARGDAIDSSDVDLLVDIQPPARALDYFGLLEDLERALSELVGRDVDVVDSKGLTPGSRFCTEVLREAVAL